MPSFPKSLKLAGSPGAGGGAVGLYDSSDTREAFAEMLLGGHKHIAKLGAPTAPPYGLATVRQIGLPDNARAVAVTRAFVRAGAVTGELTPVAYGATPATTQIAVSPTGDIVVLGTDAPTDWDVFCELAAFDVVEAVVDSTSAGVFAIPTSATLPDGSTINPVARGVVYLLEAEQIAGLANNVKKIILVPGAAPASTFANLNVARTQVLGNVATDGATKMRIKLAVAKAMS